jgi:DNA polymerase delta subunit 3
LSTAKKAAPKLQRSGSDFFKSSFANAKPKGKKAEVEKPKEPMPVEDGKFTIPMSDSHHTHCLTAVMMDASEEENVEDFPTEAAESEEATAKRKAERASRAEKLKHIFDDEDDSQPGKLLLHPFLWHYTKRCSVAEDVAMDDAPEPEEEPTDDAPIDKEEAAKPAEPEPPPTISGGRRRAKRKVMKKKKVEDEEGYLGKFVHMVWMRQ